MREKSSRYRSDLCKWKADLLLEGRQILIRTYSRDTKHPGVWVCVCFNPSAVCVCVSGWKFGAVFGRSGAFPAECTHPVAPPDFLSLPLDRKSEPRGGAGQFAVSSAIAVAVASTMAAHEIDQTIEVHRHTTQYVVCFFSLWVSGCFSLSVFGWFFRRFLLTALLKEIWMRERCRTVNMTCWSSPRSTSDRETTWRGETRREICTHRGNHRTHLHNTDHFKSSGGKKRIHSLKYCTWIHFNTSNYNFTLLLRHFLSGILYFLLHYIQLTHVDMSYLIFTYKTHH